MNMELGTDLANLGEDRDIEIDLKKAGIGVLILVLAVTSIYYFQRTQNLESQADSALVEVDSLESDIRELEASLAQANNTLEFVRDRNSEISRENGQLRMKVDRPMVSIDYRSKSSDSGQTTVELDARNYGNMTAEDVQASCSVYREGADQSYDTFNVEISELSNRTVQTISTSVTLSEEPQSSDMVSCQVESCEGLCQPLIENVNRFNTNYPRKEFN